jgi:hypothetical protein
MKGKDKVKVKLSLCFNRALRHEGVLGEWRYSSIHSLTSALDGGEWSASRPGRFTPKERASGTHGIGGWVGPRAVLDAVVKRKIPSLRRESNPRTPINQPVPQRYTDWAITAPKMKGTPFYSAVPWVSNPCAIRRRTSVLARQLLRLTRFMTLLCKQGKQKRCGMQYYCQCSVFQTTLPWFIQLFPSINSAFFDRCHIAHYFQSQ